MSICGVLLIVFIVLKLLGLIAWSWWIVISPTYFGIVIFIYGLCKASAKRV